MKKKREMQGGIEKNNEIRGVECVSLLRDRLLEGCLSVGYENTNSHYIFKTFLGKFILYV